MPSVNEYLRRILEATEAGGGSNGNTDTGSNSSVTDEEIDEITNNISAIQTTLSVTDSGYDTLREIVTKLQAAERTLDNHGDVVNKDVGNQAGNVQINGAAIGNNEVLETDSTGKLITATKKTAYNTDFGTSNEEVARGDASYLKDQIDTLLTENKKNDTDRANHTGEQAIDTITNLQTQLYAKEISANKGKDGGYASLDTNGKVPVSQLPSYVNDIEEYNNLDEIQQQQGSSGIVYLDLDTSFTYRWSGSTYVRLNDVDLSDYFSKSTDTLDNIKVGTTNKHFTSDEQVKLLNIKDNATADQTDEEIKTAYERNTNTNAFTDTELIKLENIENGAAVNVKSDLSVTDSGLDSFVKNKSTEYIEDFKDKRYVLDSEKILLDNTSGSNTGDETTLSIQTKRPLKTIKGKDGGYSLEGEGDIDLTKDDVGLGNVDNTSDADKPISTAAQSVLDDKLETVSVDGSTVIGDGVTVPLSASPTLTGVQSVTGDVVDNTDTENPVILLPSKADLDSIRPLRTVDGEDLTDGNGDISVGVIGVSGDGVSGTSESVVLTFPTADEVADSATTNKFVTQAQIDIIDNTSGSNAGDETTLSIQTKRPLKTIKGKDGGYSLEGEGDIDLTKDDVGLGNVDNTSDADKPISTAAQSVLDDKLSIENNLSDVSSQQDSLNNITNVSAAFNGYVLTYDESTGNAIFAPQGDGGSGTNLRIGTQNQETLSVESDTGTNATIPAATTNFAGLFTAAEKVKLETIDSFATAQTDEEIKTAYERNTDTNAFTDDFRDKLEDIKEGATRNLNATESDHGVGFIATTLDAKEGIVDTNKFINPKKLKEVIEAHEEQKIFVYRYNNIEEEYNGEDGGTRAPIKFTTLGVDKGVGLTYDSSEGNEGVFTVSKSCRLTINIYFSFKNNSDTTKDDTSFIEIQKSTDDGSSFDEENPMASITINPSEQTDAGKELEQSLTANLSFDAGDKFRAAITDIALTQVFVNRIINITEQ